LLLSKFDSEAIMLVFASERFDPNRVNAPSDL